MPRLPDYVVRMLRGLPSPAGARLRVRQRERPRSWGWRVLERSTMATWKWRSSFETTGSGSASAPNSPAGYCRLLKPADSIGSSQTFRSDNVAIRRAIEESWRRRVDEDEWRHFRTRVCPPPNEIGGSILCSRSQNPVSHWLRPWNISRQFRLIHLRVCDMMVLAVCGSLQAK